MERFSPFQEREHALSKAEISLFLDGAARAQRREMLFPPSIPALNRDALRASAERHGYNAHLDRADANLLSISEKPPKIESERARMRASGRSLPWSANLRCNPYWQSERSEDPNTSFQWKIHDFWSVTSLPLKQREELDALLEKDIKERDALLEQRDDAEPHEQEALKAAWWKVQQRIDRRSFLFKDAFANFLAQEITGLPLIPISVPRSIPSQERDLLLRAIPSDDPLRGFLDGTFDDCVYRFETEEHSSSGEGSTRILTPNKTGEKVTQVFVSTDPEDVFWYAKEAEKNLAYTDMHASVDYSIKVIRPKRFHSVDLARKRGHDPDLDRYELALEEGVALATFPIKDQKRFYMRSADPLLQLCVRGPRKLHEYGVTDPHWNLTEETWLTHHKNRSKKV